MDSQAQKFRVNQILTIFLLSYYFFNLLIFFFFQEIYNTRLQERYKDNHSTYPKLDLELWLEVGSSGGLDRNRVYGISNTMIEDIQTGRNVSTYYST